MLNIFYTMQKKKKRLLVLSGVHVGSSTMQYCGRKSSLKKRWAQDTKNMDLDLDSSFLKAQGHFNLVFWFGPISEGKEYFIV